MADRQAVEHRVCRYDGAVVVGERVEDRGADAVAGGAAGDDQRVDGAVDQVGQEGVPWKELGFFLVKTRSPGSGATAFTIALPWVPSK